MMMVLTLTINAQEKDAATLKNMIETKQFVFKPRMVSPQTGGSRIVTSEYDLVLKEDKVVSYLPYFGRAYSSSYMVDGGIKFTSEDFSYTTKAAKSGWKITIKPNDASGVQEMYLDITKSGYASLYVTSSNRQGISFYGIVEQVK